MEFFALSITLTLILFAVYTHPVNTRCVRVCNLNITASTEFLNEWLNQSNTVGIHQFQDHKDMVVHGLLKDASTEVSLQYLRSSSCRHTPTYVCTYIDGINSYGLYRSR